ncbi:MAG: hypothetical protein R6X18_03875 [Chloroflexota bacterium]
MLISLVACDNPGVQTAVEPVATAAVATPLIQPTSSPTPEPTAGPVPVVVGLNHINDWRPPILPTAAAEEPINEAVECGRVSQTLRAGRAEGPGLFGGGE